MLKDHQGNFRKSWRLFQDASFYCQCWHRGQVSHPALLTVAFGALSQGKLYKRKEQTQLNAKHSQMHRQKSIQVFSQSFVWICFVLTLKGNSPLKQTPFTETNKDPRFPWLKRCDSLFRIKAGASLRWKEAGVQPRCSANWLQLHMTQAPILTQWTDWKWNESDNATLLQHLFTTEHSNKNPIQLNRTTQFYFDDKYFEQLCPSPLHLTECSVFKELERIPALGILNLFAT